MLERPDNGEEDDSLEHSVFMQHPSLDFRESLQMPIMWEVLFNHE